MYYFRNKNTWYLDDIIPDYDTWKTQISDMCIAPENQSIMSWYDHLFWQNFYNKFCKSNVSYINQNHFLQDLMTMYNDTVYRNQYKIQTLFDLYNLSIDDITLLNDSVANFATQMNREIQPNEIINRVRDQTHGRVSGGKLERLYTFITNIPTLDIQGELEPYKQLFLPF